MIPPPRHQKTSSPERFYRLLLLCYPRDFRKTYGPELIQTFRDCYRAALQKNGRGKIVRLWYLMFYDLTTTVISEHVKALIARINHSTSIDERTMVTLMTHFNLNVAQLTDVGRKRPNNEDAVGYIIPSEPEVLAKKGALFVVSDGLGGHNNGEIASSLAVQAISETYYQSGEEETEQALQQAIKQANTQVHQAGKQMGTTCVTAVLKNDMLYVANVGDSRAYIVRSGDVKQISRDHSIVADELRAGLITKEQVREHPQRNVITRCLGTKEEVEVDLFSEQVQSGDLLVLCTDGLFTTLSDDEIGQIVQQYQPEESVAQLIAHANEQGGPDNITVLVVQVSLEKDR